MGEDGQQDARVFAQWLTEAKRSQIAYTLGGGFLGGLFSPLVRKFLKTDADFDLGTSFPQAWDTWVLGMVFGAICAGFVVYVLSVNANHNRRQLFFIGLASGLTFPTILANTTGFEDSGAAVKALATVEQQLEKSAQETKDTPANAAATQENNDEKVAVAKESADLIEATVQQTPAEKLNSEARRAVDEKTESLVEQIARESERTDDKETKEALAREVKGAAEAASAQGYRAAESNPTVQKVIRGVPE